MARSRRPEARDLLALLEEVRKAPSGLGRARLLVRSAGALRRMSREERLRLLTAVGFEQADELVERMDEHGDPELRSTLQDLLARFEAAGPKRWAEMARDLREPEGRSRLLRQGLDLLAGPPAAAEEEAPDLGEPEEIELPAIDTGESDAAAPGAEDAGAAEPGRPAVPPVPGAVPPPPGAEPTRERGDRGAPAPETPPPAAPRPAPETAPTSGGPAPAAAPPAAAKPAPAPVVAAPEWPVPATAAPPLVPTGRLEPASHAVRRPYMAEPPTRLAAGAVLRRLARLRRGTEELEGAGPERLLRLLEGFPAGWPRRRALTTLLRAGIPAEIGAALELVEATQERPAARLFCLGTLAARPDLGPQDKDRLLAAAASGAERRRLALRLARRRR